MAARLNRRHATSVREKIKATQIYNKIEAHVLERCSCFKPDEKQRPCSVADPTGAKLAMYSLDQSIGRPPQELRGEVNVNVRAQVQSIVATFGPERARAGLQAFAPALLTYLEGQSAIEGELVED